MTFKIAPKSNKIGGIFNGKNKNEYEKNIQILKMGSYTGINYNDGNSFNLNINFINNKIDIITRMNPSLNDYSISFKSIMDLKSCWESIQVKKH